MSHRRVFHWQTDTGACHLYRSVYPLTHLDPDRFSCAWGAPGPDIHDYNVVVAQRLPWQSDLWEGLCRDPAVLAVYDMDDWLLGVDPENTVPYSVHHPLEPQTRRNVEMADVVTVSTLRLAESVYEVNPRVKVLENCLHPSSVEIEPVFDRQDTVIGWAGSPFHHQDFGGIPEQMQLVRGALPAASFHSMGGHFLGVPSRHTPGFMPMDSYLSKLDFTIGIAPLMETHFNDCKSWCKTLEYASRGIVPVAQKWGQYPDWVAEETNGLLVQGHGDEWFNAIVTLANAPAVRTAMAYANFQKAREWTIDKHVHKWESVYGG